MMTLVPIVPIVVRVLFATGSVVILLSPLLLLVLVLPVLMPAHRVLSRGLP
jgi:hypothetical protein